MKKTYYEISIYFKTNTDNGPQDVPVQVFECDSYEYSDSFIKLYKAIEGREIYELSNLIVVVNIYNVDIEEKEYDDEDELLKVGLS